MYLFLKKINYCGDINMQVVKIEGANPYERGLAHGKKLKEQVQAMFKISEKFNKEYYNFSSFKQVGELMLQTPAVIDPINRHTPWLLEEIKGISEGVGIDYEAVLGFQVLHLHGVINNLNLLSSQENSKQNSANPNLQCTVVGGYQMPQNGTILAQNCDQALIWDGYQILFHIIEPENDLEIMTVAYPGFVGTYGLNNKGVGLCFNSMPVYLDEKFQGLPVIFLGRGILNKTNIDEAMNFIEQQNLSSGLVCTFGDPSKIVCYECSPAQNAQFIPKKYPRYVYHTNHPLVVNDYSQKVLDHLNNPRSSSLEDLSTAEIDIVNIMKDAIKNSKLQESLIKYELVGQLQNSRIRLQTVEKYLDKHEDTLTVENIKEILSSKDHEVHTICMDPKRNIIYKLMGLNTNFSIIMELSENPVFHVADGPPCKKEYQTFTFN